MHLLRRVVWQRRPTGKLPAAQRRSTRVPVRHGERTESERTSQSGPGHAL